MKAKFLVEISQYYWFFPLSRSKNPTDTCQSDWIPLEYLWFSVSLSSAPIRIDSLGMYPHHQFLHTFWSMQHGEGGMIGIPRPSSLGVRSHLGHPGQSVSSVQGQCPYSFILLTLPLHVGCFSWRVLATAFAQHSALLFAGNKSGDSLLGISLGIQVSWGGARSAVLTITTWKQWSPAVLPISLNLLLGKGRKSQKRICMPNSNSATALSVETVGQKWRETKHASHVAAPSTRSSWEGAKHSQPFWWGHFNPNSCAPFVLLDEDRESAQPNTTFGCNSN